jgi:hypothetical protein
VTEAEFNHRKANLTRKQQVADAMIAEATKIRSEATESMIALLGACTQEPWWGEAND